MSDIKRLWQETKEFVDSCERKIAERYIAFLREVAKFYLQKGRRVFFNENKVVHYGEGGFGWMIIEGEEDIWEAFGDYIPEIRFETKIDEKIPGRYNEIKEDNMEDIRYNP